jgi:hypothetical protein
MTKAEDFKKAEQLSSKAVKNQKLATILGAIPRLLPVTLKQKKI